MIPSCSPPHPDSRRRLGPAKRLACAAVLALGVPTALTAAVIATPSTASAQPAPDPVTDVARQRYQDGVKAYEAGNYEEARNAFMQAYQLKHLPVVLLNLG